MSKPTFESLNLKKNLVAGIFAHGFEEPSNIQIEAIPAITQGKDTICEAQSGTGKTATFAISALQRLDETSKNTQALVLSPTRELAIQSHAVITSIGERMTVTTHCFVGGITGGLQQDNSALQEGVQIAVGTPGRIIEMINENKMRCTDIKMIIIDEADEMLSRGFEEDMVKIFKAIPKTAQIVLVSATMPKEILELTEQFMTSPTSILVKEDELTLDGIREYQVQLEDEWKLSTMLDIFKVVQVSEAVIFLNTIPRAKHLYEELKKQQFNCIAIHSEMDQTERNQALSEFRAGKYRVLIGTNVVARGIDVENVSLVVNYDIPKSPEQYLHRIGRSGRFGRKGFAINFVSEKDGEMMKLIVEKFATKIEAMPADLSKLI